jgi:hypothetical protein
LRRIGLPDHPGFRRGKHLARIDPSCGRICGDYFLQVDLRADAEGFLPETTFFPDASARETMSGALLPQMRPAGRAPFFSPPNNGQKS